MRTFCHRCGADTLATRLGRCSVCDEQLVSQRRVVAPARPRVDRGRPFVDVALVERAYQEWYVRDGLSLRRCADRLLAEPGVYYASRESAARMLERQWAIRGLPLRDRVAASVAAHWKDGTCRRDLRAAGAPEHLATRRARARRNGTTRGVACAATARRTGQPCARAALTGSDYCIAHDPVRSAEVAQRLADARSRSPSCRPRTLETAWPPPSTSAARRSCSASRQRSPTSRQRSATPPPPKRTCAASSSRRTAPGRPSPRSRGTPA